MAFGCGGGVGFEGAFILFLILILLVFGMFPFFVSADA